MELNIKAAEWLLNERAGIIDMPQSGPADKAYLSGAIAALQMLGLSIELIDGKYRIFDYDSTERDT